MRSWDLIEFLTENDSIWAHVDEPGGQRWILSLEEWDFGHIIVYDANKCNVATGRGPAHFGYQDSVRTIINRGKSRLTPYETPLDLSSTVCP